MNTKNYKTSKYWRLKILAEQLRDNTESANTNLYPTGEGNRQEMVNLWAKSTRIEKFWRCGEEIRVNKIYSTPCWIVHIYITTITITIKTTAKIISFFLHFLQKLSI